MFQLTRELALPFDGYSFEKSFRVVRLEWSNSLKMMVFCFKIFPKCRQVLHETKRCVMRVLGVITYFFCVKIGDEEEERQNIEKLMKTHSSFRCLLVCNGDGSRGMWDVSVDRRVTLPLADRSSNANRITPARALFLREQFYDLWEIFLSRKGCRSVGGRLNSYTLSGTETVRWFNLFPTDICIWILDSVSWILDTNPK